MPLKVLAFAGSLRKGSYNKQLIRVAAGFARDEGAEVTEIDLAAHPLPSSTRIWKRVTARRRPSWN